MTGVDIALLIGIVTPFFLGIGLMVQKNITLTDTFNWIKSWFEPPKPPAPLPKIDRLDELTDLHFKTFDQPLERHINERKLLEEARQLLMWGERKLIDLTYVEEDDEDDWFDEEPEVIEVKDWQGNTVYKSSPKVTRKNQHICSLHSPDFECRYCIGE